MKNVTAIERPLPDEIMLTAEEIAELGIDEAPEDLGPSLEKSLTTKNGRPDHG